MDLLESFLISKAMRFDVNNSVCEGKFSNE